MKYPAWQIKTAEAGAEEKLASAGCGVLLRRVLAARGCKDAAAAHQLLEPSVDLSDPFLLRDMDKAVARIEQAIEAEEPIVIYGDYDVDGISATAILYECLSSQGAHVRCKLPTRGSGYGLTRPALEALARKGFTLVITVDNGISAVEEAACAKELGLDLVITDHHLPGETLPDAVAVVDPKRADDESPFKNLCGAGVAFKLCAALEGCDPAELLEMYGEFVALGTVADVMPLVGENRVLVREGLALLQDTMRPGLHALLESGGYAGKPVTTDTVSYGLAPRLNAAGRMDNASVALKLLLCGDEEQATGIAARLAEINTERQQTEQDVFAAACRTLETDPARLQDRVLVVSGEDWHPGVIGIVAARLMERYSRPVLVISLHEGEGRGSGRAPDAFDLHSALAACAGHLTRFGGHAAAAGIEIEEEKLPAFRQAINEWAAQHAARPAPATLQLDAVVTLEELDLPNVQELTRLAPFGRENPTPVLLVQNAVVDGVWAMGAEGRHTRVRLRQGNHTLFASLFGIPPQQFAYPVGAAVEAALEVSVFTGRSGPMVSAHLKGIRPANLSNTPSEQAAWFEAFRTGAVLEPVRAEALLPERNDTVMLYKRIRSGQVFTSDLQPVFAAQGPENTGKTLASLLALQELGLIEEQNGRWLPVPVSQKQDLASAPVLKKLAQQAAQG
ncbi:MAG TPA: single-stranded-DNA-specific exonuclease RecJ [Candidatus Gemmiger excrementigallinarum]|uniref:Single-stranded-DNA-specific exonuclease RecJ n=1 Tax=Candidatus Gemmiger excrementigallinarum TaxID=2838609 RepID=A0A9D2JB85_9FIRM|nr:single-stranded-DNA-specific exonuclease RecJ [Candidatus Gemmiger excrementigallinarum]